MNKYIGILLLILTFTSCGESLEDTYKDYAGDGEIRYLGKCSDLSVKPGWERLIVNWVNGVDPRIDKVKVTWSLGSEENEILLDKGTTEFNIPDLQDGNYEVTVCSVDQEGKTSLVTTAYARPYTESHETVQAFTRIISRHFFIKDRLVLFFLGWEDYVDLAYLTYTKKDGSAGRLDLTPEIVNSLYYLMPDKIDPSKPVSLLRSGYIEGCDDKIIFTPVELEKEKLFNGDFKLAMKRQFGFDPDIPADWAESVQEIDLDWSIGNFADLLYLPNLKKLVLGKHRYLRADMVNDASRSQSLVYEKEMSDFVLKTLAELNGLKVERYNKHFPTLASAPYLEEKGFIAVPTDLNFLDLKNLTFTSKPKDKENYNSHLEYLTDNNPSSNWEPYPLSSSANYVLQLDLGSIRRLNGIKLVQTYFDEVNKDKRAKSPDRVKIFVSDDGLGWKNATYLEDINIGNSTGETNIIPFVEGGLSARYVQVQAPTVYYVQNYELILAEIGLY